jgi:hypothetical protein
MTLSLHLEEEVGSFKLVLTPSLFIDVPVPIQESEQSGICVSRVPI